MSFLGETFYEKTLIVGCTAKAQRAQRKPFGINYKMFFFALNALLR